MAVKLGIPVQLGGGIRTVETIETLLCKGIHRVYGDFGSKKSGTGKTGFKNF